MSKLTSPDTDIPFTFKRFASMISTKHFTQTRYTAAGAGVAGSSARRPALFPPGGKASVRGRCAWHLRLFHQSCLPNETRMSPRSSRLLLLLVICWTISGCGGVGASPELAPPTATTRPAAARPAPTATPTVAPLLTPTALPPTATTRPAATPPAPTAAASPAPVATALLPAATAPVRPAVIALTPERAGQTISVTVGDIVEFAPPRDIPGWDVSYDAGTLVALPQAEQRGAEAGGWRFQARTAGQSELAFTSRPAPCPDPQPCPPTIVRLTFYLDVRDS